MRSFIDILIALSAASLILVVLLQNQGSGLGEAYGGGGNSYRSKRGVERSLFTITIILGVVFVGGLIVRLILA